MRGPSGSAIYLHELRGKGERGRGDKRLEGDERFGRKSETKTRCDGETKRSTKERERGEVKVDVAEGLVKERGDKYERIE
mmetsp:Transcript_1021/g.1793  ORF Transcript_1021/g.1793 Transcript_1021/m.1793 type:complete len:80 (+) Transcript_1021:21-260(+)